MEPKVYHFPKQECDRLLQTGDQTKSFSVDEKDGSKSLITLERKNGLHTLTVLRNNHLARYTARHMPQYRTDDVGVDDVCRHTIEEIVIQNGGAPVHLDPSNPRYETVAQGYQWFFEALLRNG